MAKARRVIALEEHYQDPSLTAHTHDEEAKRPASVVQRLDDVDALRLKEMDEAGIDVQILSHRGPSPQDMAAATAVASARNANDRLFEIVNAHPSRFAGFAALPTSDPLAASNELERAVVKLGFKGSIVHGLTNGLFLDDRRFWPIFERSCALGVPVYVHPANPHPAVVDAYYKDYAEKYPMLLRAGWSYTVETATQVVRLVLSGVFDAYPDLKIIVGHLGESVPFSLWRINRYLSMGPGKSFADIFRRHFYITTSGNFSFSALECSIAEMGIDRIMFAVDWPYESNTDAMAWLTSAPIEEEHKAKILGGNAERLFNL